MINDEIYEAVNQGYFRRHLHKTVDVDLNAIDNSGNTSLLRAVSVDNLDAVNFLVNKGADVNAKGKQDWTPLHEAARRGNLNIVKFLVDNGSVVNATAKHGNTPIATAAAHGRRYCQMLCMRI